jgi:membrane protein
MPDEAAATVRPQLERVLQGRDGGLLSLGLALTIYAASSGIRALSKALNLAYDITEARPLWRQYAVAIGLTIGVGTVAILAFLVLTSGRLLVEWLAHEAGMADVATTVIGPATLVLTLVALVAAIAVLYRVAPARHPSWRGVLPGVAVFVPGWLLATFGLSIYIENFGSYADTYGALAGVIILLLWFYISSIILLVGGELNAAVERRSGGVGSGYIKKRGSDDVT